MATQKPDLTRVWANGAPPANVVDPDTTTPGKVTAGWQAEVPPFEHFNFLQKWFTQGLAHFNEQGIGVWDTDTTYPVNGLAKGSDGEIYQSVLEQNGNDPTTDNGTNWRKFLSSSQLIFSDVPNMQSGTLVSGKSVSLKLGDRIKIESRDNAEFVITSDTPNGANIVDTTIPGLSATLILTGAFLKIKEFGADGTSSNDTLAFYEAFSISGLIDLQGLTINVTVTSQTDVNKPVYIKDGNVNFSSATLLRVFIWKSGDLFRFENVKVLGNSNGSIDDSFDATSGTFALIRAELDADGDATNLQLENSRFERLVVCEDNKNSATIANNFNVIGGYARGNEFYNIPGHAFSFNCWNGIKITQNKFFDVGALCVDFACFTQDCIFEDNEINGASGVGKTQIRKNSGAAQIPQNNSISNNRATNITGGNSSNVAVFKLAGLNDLCENNKVRYDGTSNVDSIEAIGSCSIINNKIDRTVDTSRSYISTISDSDIPNPDIFISRNKGSGMLNFARLQNTSIARITISENRPDTLSKFINGEANLNLPGLKILDNEFDSSLVSGVGIQFANTTVDLSRLKVHGNTCKSEGTCLVAWEAEGASVTGNSFDHATGNNLDIINTDSYVVTGNSANASWATTSLEKIVENNTVFV